VHKVCLFTLLTMNYFSLKVEPRSRRAVSRRYTNHRLSTEVLRELCAMNTKSLQLDPVGRPRLTLAIYWICWKTVLLLVALSSPGNGYDTSTAVLFAQYDQLSSYTHLVQHALQKLVRWDAVYFTQIAHRGTRFEQEWAFGWGFARLLNLGGRGTETVTLVEKQLC